MEKNKIVNHTQELLSHERKQYNYNKQKLGQQRDLVPEQRYIMKVVYMLSHRRSPKCPTIVKKRNQFRTCISYRIKQPNKAFITYFKNTPIVSTKATSNQLSLQYDPDFTTVFTQHSQKPPRTEFYYLSFGFMHSQLVSMQPNHNFLYFYLKRPRIFPLPFHTTVKILLLMPCSRLLLVS